MHFGIFILRADQFDLALDGFTRFFILARAVACDEQRRFGRLWRPREGMFRNRFLSASEENFSYAVVRADGAAIVNRLHSPRLHAFARLEAQFARDHFVSEVAFADEERDAKDARLVSRAQHSANGGLFFPKGRENLAENLAALKLVCVLMGRR